MKLTKLKGAIACIASGSLAGCLVSILLGATAVGVLGAGFGGSALIVFSIAGGIIGLAAYGGYRAIKN